MAGKKYKFKKGDRVRVVGAASGHQIPIDTIATIQAPYGQGYYRLNEYPNWNILMADLELIPCNFTKASLEGEKAKLVAAVATLDAKLAFLDETGQDEGTDREFRVYQTLSLVEDKKLTKQQKAKAIAGLLDDNN